jgi:acetyltransferase
MTRPYPKEFDRPAMIGAGASLRIRPIRPEDESGLVELVAGMTPDDRRLRFFTQFKELPQALAARFARVDYDREMALIATPMDDNTVLGVARYAADAALRQAEFALAVRSDWHHRGLGHLLMTRLIEAAKARGIGALYGDVLRENATMIELCREIGLTAKNHPDDPILLRLTLALSGRGDPQP